MILSIRFTSSIPRLTALQTNKKNDFKNKIEVESENMTFLSIITVNFRMMLPEFLFNEQNNCFLNNLKKNQ